MQPAILEETLRLLHALLIILFLAAPLYAEQALVLTEIEQIQEKIWYLQRDFAAQKTTFEKQQAQLSDIATQLEEGQVEIGDKLDTLGQAIAAQEQFASKAEGQLQALNESLFELNDKVIQQDKTVLEMAGKIGALEGSLQALRTEVSSQQSRNELALGEMREQLAASRAQFEAVQQNTKGQMEQVGLWGGAAVLGLAVILTIVFALGSNKRKRGPDQKEAPRHEL